MDKMRFLGCFALFVSSLLAQNGQDTFEKVCSKCHPAEQAASKRHSKAGWEHTVDDMVAKGAEGTDQQFDAIVQYLTAAYGPVNVNAASAKELEESRVFTAAESAAIVRFRGEHGRIADLNALKKISGIDANKVEKKADGIGF
jgi:competence protein ComEA